jgi:hypothetical protein
MLPRRHQAIALALFALAIGFLVRGVHHHRPHTGHEKTVSLATPVHEGTHQHSHTGHAHTDRTHLPSETSGHSHSDPFAPDHDEHHQCHFCMVLGQAAENPSVSKALLPIQQDSQDRLPRTDQSIDQDSFQGTPFLRGPPETLLS